jgi:D-amino peptidase
MKIFISADIEGVTGTTHWEETNPSKPEYAAFAAQMTAEAAAACEGALAAGANQILVKDAHNTARNIDASKLPVQAELGRGWSWHPFGMMEGLDDSFEAVLLVGYHSAAGSGANPLAHTLSSDKLTHLKINDQTISEFALSTYTATLLDIPVMFLSGDAGVCAEAQELVPGITTVPVKQGCGSSTTSIHPKLAVERIRQGAASALQGDLGKCRIELPRHFRVEVGYKEHTQAMQYSFYPGASLGDANTVLFETDQFFEVLRLLAFVV